MRPGVKANIYCDTEPHAYTIRDRLLDAITRLRVEPVIEEAPSVVNHHGRWLVNCSLRCNTELDADDFYGRATQTWLTAVDRNRIQGGSFVDRFNAYDDEPGTEPDTKLYGLRKE